LRLKGAEEQKANERAETFPHNLILDVYSSHYIKLLNHLASGALSLPLRKIYPISLQRKMSESRTFPLSTALATAIFDLAISFYFMSLYSLN